ncbi:MAG: dipeptidase [Candidatus Aminicenantes bacterium]|nr:MAG: dipeptidase [Candidatus Aminicenantes bacterium]
MRQKLSLSFLAFLFLIGSFTLASAKKKDLKLTEKSQKIHDEAIVIDAHAHDFIYGQWTLDEFDLGRKTGKSQVDFVTMKEGGLDAMFLSLPHPGYPDRENSSKNIFDSVNRIRNQIKKYPELSELALTAADIKRIHRSGKRAVLLSIESAHPLEGQITLLETYYELGIRAINVQHSKRDPIAKPKRGNAGDSGLSEFGKKVVREMNRLGMLIDITHTADYVQLDIIKESKAPVVASHSCLRALQNIPRNIPDHILKAIAKKGGAVMITFDCGYLSSDFMARAIEANEKQEIEKKKLEKELKDDKVALDSRLKALEKKLAPERVGIEFLIDHIDHAVKTAGVDHVGIGSDFVGHPNPVGLETAQGLPLITYHLLKRGYEEEEIKKILGGNLLRIIEEVQKQSEKF